MRTLLPSALATLVTCLPVLAQTFGYEIDVNPPRNENANNPTLGEWLNPNEITGQYYSDGFRIRILAEPGTWVRPLFDFKLDEQLTSGEPPAWLANNPWLENIGTMTSLQGLSSPLASVFGSTPNQLEIHGYENVGIPRPDSFMRWLSFAVKNGTSTPVSTGVKQWCQPVLTTSSYRLWQTNPVLWETGNGYFSKLIWNGQLQEGADGNSTFSFYGGLRYAILEHASFQNHPEWATQLMNSPTWNQVISDVLLRLAIQVVGLKPPQSSGAASDPETDPIQLPEMPLIFVTPSWSFRVELPPPAQSKCNNLVAANMVPGSLHVFTCSEGRYPMLLRFTTITNGVYGEVEVAAVATPSLTNPSAYAVRVPENFVPAPIALKHGDMTQWMDVDSYALLPN